MSLWYPPRLPPAPQACHGCQKVFEEADRKHHCRSCGEGFCQPCSSHRMPVPERGWGNSPVRVCKACYRQGGPPDSSSQGETHTASVKLLTSCPCKSQATVLPLYRCFFISHTHLLLFSLVCKVEPRGLIARRVTEMAQSTLDMVSTAVDYPLCECSCNFITTHCSR